MYGFGNQFLESQKIYVIDVYVICYMLYVICYMLYVICYRQNGVSLGKDLCRKGWLYYTILILVFISHNAWQV